MGMDEDPIDLRLLASGELLLAGQQPASLRLCQPESWSCRELGHEALEVVKRQFKIIQGHLPGQWLLSDAHGDGLWEWSEGHSAMLGRLPPRTLAGPNGLAFDGDGHLWVADTDHRRIVEVVAVEEGPWVTGREHNTVNELTIGGRFYPMMLEFADDGRLWVIQATDFSEAHSDLVAYDPDKGAVAVAGLPEDAYATDLAVLGDSVLVTDMERFAIYHVDSTALTVSGFGDSRFLDQMEHYQAQRKMYGRLGTFLLAAIVVVGFFLVFVAIRATPRGRRWSQVPAPIDPENSAKTVPDIKGIHWLERNPKMRWMLNWFERSFYILFALLCLCSALLYAWSCRQPWTGSDGGLTESTRFGLVLLLACLAVASFIPMIHFSARAFKRRVGTDGKRIHLELEDGRRLVVDTERLAFNNRALLYRQYIFPLQAGRNKRFYAENEIETWLLPLLRDSLKLNEWQTLKYQWKNLDGLILSTAVAVVFMAIVFLVAQLLGRG